jgi:hypothetical protein
MQMIVTKPVVLVQNCRMFRANFDDPQLFFKHVQKRMTSSSSSSSVDETDQNRKICCLTLASDGQNSAKVKILQKLTCVLDVHRTKKLNAQKFHVFFTRRTATQKHKTRTIISQPWHCQQALVIGANNDPSHPSIQQTSTPRASSFSKPGWWVLVARAAALSQTSFRTFFSLMFFCGAPNPRWSLTPCFFRKTQVGGGGVILNGPSYICVFWCCLIAVICLRSAQPQLCN